MKSPYRYFPYAVLLTICLIVYSQPPSKTQAQPISVEHQAEKEYDAYWDKVERGEIIPDTVTIPRNYNVQLPLPLVTVEKPGDSVTVDSAAPAAPVAASDAKDDPETVPADRTRENAPQKPQRKPKPKPAADVAPIPVSIKGPENIAPGSFSVAAIVTVPPEITNPKLEWQIEPDPGREHREIGQLGEGKWLLLFIDPPAGKYTIVAVAKQINEGEDAIGLGWLSTTVGTPVPPTPTPVDTDGDGIPDDKDPCPKDPHNICNDNPEPPPGPVSFDSAVIIVEKQNMSTDHAVLLSNLPFWRSLTNGHFRVYDEQSPEVTEKGYDRMMKDAGVQPPALILMNADGTVAKAGTLPDSTEATSAFVGK